MNGRSAAGDGLPIDTRILSAVGGALAYVVAAIHVFHPERGFGRLLLLARVGRLELLATDPRPLLFVLSGLAIVAGVLAVMLGTPRRPIYAAGIALVATYFLGYFAWHLSGHGGFLPARQPVYHGMSPIEAVVDHLVTSPIAAAAKLAEALLLGVLVVLYRRL